MKKNLSWLRAKKIDHFISSTNLLGNQTGEEDQNFFSCKQIRTLFPSSTNSSKKICSRLTAKSNKLVEEDLFSVNRKKQQTDSNTFSIFDKQHIRGSPAGGFFVRKVKLRPSEPKETLFAQHGGGQKEEETHY